MLKVETVMKRKLKTLAKQIGIVDYLKKNKSFNPNVKNIDYRIAEIESNLNGIFRGLPKNEWSNTTNLDRLYTRHGVFRSTSKMSAADKFDANQFFQYRDKAEMALCPASIWVGGDYMEFGSTDLNTFRNFLTAFDIFNNIAVYPNTKFYGFDIFGKVDASKATNSEIDSSDGYREYINLFKERGDLLPENIETLKNHGLFVKNCELIQGFFEDTLTEQFKSNYLQQGRKVGFACLDCNIAPPYKLVFEFLVDLMQPQSFIYMDEYYSGAVIQYFEQFMTELKKRYNMEARLIRNAGGFGALFYLYTVDVNLTPLEFK